MKYKVCKGCNRELPATTEYFHLSKKEKYGLRNKCKDCRSSRKEGKELAKHSKVENGLKLCVGCDRWLPCDLAHFHRDYKGLEGLQARCKECWGSTFGIKQHNKVFKKEGFFYCQSCEEFKEEKYFYKNKTSQCKKCESNRKNNYRREKLNALKTENDLTAKEWEECKGYFNHSCCYCGKKETDKVLHQDHFLAMSKGGLYTKENIVPACQSCNTLKHNHNFYVWYKKQPFYNKDREQKIITYLKEVNTEVTKDSKKSLAP